METNEKIVEVKNEIVEEERLVVGVKRKGVDMELLRMERPTAERAVLKSEASFRGLSCQIGSHIVQALRYEYEGGPVERA